MNRKELETIQIENIMDQIERIQESVSEQLTEKRLAMESKAEAIIEIVTLLKLKEKKKK